MNVQKQVNLQDFHTFRLSKSVAEYFVEINSLEDFEELIDSDFFDGIEYYILGGGSNAVFNGKLRGLVIHNVITEHHQQEDGDSIIMTYGSGNNWHDMVMQSTRQELWGLQNMALIPGTVGGAVVGNIGAYGSEVKDILVDVYVYDFEAQQYRTLSNHDCDFSYRNSIFKKNPQRFFIIRARLRLQKTMPEHEEVFSYKALREYYSANNNISSQDLANKVIAIRDSKLPRVSDIGTAGSFFKNTIVPKGKIARLLKTYPNMVYYELENNKVKISTAWLLDYLGYKGIRRGDIGTYNKHALVLVNHGNANGEDLRAFVEEIKKRVFNEFGLTIEEEVDIVSSA